MKKQHQHQAHMQNGNNDTTNVDPGILAFGTSVSINDDLRRSISNEIQEIDSNCTKIKDDINIESKIQDELSKGKVHANNEIAALCQGVIDANDALHMNTQILHGLANTLQTEIASHRSNPEHTTESDNNEVDSTSLEYIRKGQMSRSKRLVELKSSIISKVNQLNEMNIKKKEIQESSEIISMKIDEELEMPLTKAIESTLHAQRILDSEISRIHSMNVNVVAATERVEAMKKKLENKVRMIHLQRILIYLHFPYTMKLLL